MQISFAIAATLLLATALLSLRMIRSRQSAQASGSA
jgi:hypothetical protein